MERSDSLAALVARILDAIGQAGGWLPFDRYMNLALYAPGLGYYAAAPGVLGRWGADSDFVTAPELSPLFGMTLARQLAAAGRAEGLERVVEFGAGSGKLACDMLAAWSRGDWMPREYAIVEVSAAMRARQQDATATLPPDVRKRVVWWDRLPARFDALVVGNEVLDAMPVQLLVRTRHGWSERGIVATGDTARPFAWSDRPGAAAPRRSMDALPVGAVTETHAAAEAFIATLADHLRRGLALFIDYGFPAHEYDHPQRDSGTLRCHRAHRAHDDPLWEPGASDITAHVEFSGIARVARNAGMEILGYTSQARFLLNAGLLDTLRDALTATGDGGPAPPDRAGLALAAGVQKLVNESEMGELFKVMALGRGVRTALAGFAQGDRAAALDG